VSLPVAGGLTNGAVHLAADRMAARSSAKEREDREHPPIVVVG
jgi:hypothetical protein